MNIPAGSPVGGERLEFVNREVLLCLLGDRRGELACGLSVSTVLQQAGDGPLDRRMPGPRAEFGACAAPYDPRSDVVLIAPERDADHGYAGGEGADDGAVACVGDDEVRFGHDVLVRNELTYRDTSWCGTN